MANKEDYNKYDTMSLLELVTAMSETRALLDTAAAEKIRLQNIYDHLRENKIPEAMDEEGVNNVTYSGIGRVALTSDIYCAVPADQREEAWEWLKDNGHGGIFKVTVHGGTLKATLKAILKKGKDEIPSDLFKVTPFSRASITKIK
jgi:hypothetical protein